MNNLANVWTRILGASVALCQCHEQFSDSQYFPPLECDELEAAWQDAVDNFSKALREESEATIVTDH
jgi:hypothetical protein